MRYDKCPHKELGSMFREVGADLFDMAEGRSAVKPSWSSVMTQ